MQRVSTNQSPSAFAGLRRSTLATVRRYRPGTCVGIPWAAAFLAGKVFLAYRQNEGTSSTTLPDFFIGAHAAVTGLDLLARDVDRYRTSFPTVSLIAPER